MAKNLHESDLRLALKSLFENGELRVIGSSDAIFAQLESAFPALGSKIDWLSVPTAIESVSLDEETRPQAFASFYDSLVAEFSLSGVVTYVGDSATEFAIEGSVESLRNALPSLVRIPQHHYFVGTNAAWCITLTMEGWMAFGFSGVSRTIG